MDGTVLVADDDRQQFGGKPQIVVGGGCCRQLHHVLLHAALFGDQLDAARRSRLAATADARSRCRWLVVTLRQGGQLRL